MNISSQKKKKKDHGGEKTTEKKSSHDEGNSRFDEKMFETIKPSQVSDCLSSVPHPLPSPDGQAIQRCVIIRWQLT